jgi:mercuric reductase
LLEAEGVKVRLGVDIQSVRREGNQRTVVLGGKSVTHVHATDILVATGTRPNTETLKLDQAGIELTDKGSIKVDEQLRTTTPGIYACGDVATKYQFTHIAEYEGKIAVSNAIANGSVSIDERVVPWAVYTEPTLAHVGLTEQQAQDQQIEIVTACIDVKDIERSLLVEKQAGLMKAIARRDTGELLGVDLLSARADDLIHEAALAVRLRLSVRDIAETIHAYPTFSQGLSTITQQLAAQLDDA